MDTNIKSLFTLGYEGKSIEIYIKQLLDNNVKLLCDVRKNPISRKKGFSRNKLKEHLNSFGIEYFHIPALGIQSSSRKDLKTFNDYSKLLEDYEKNQLPECKKEIETINNLLNEHGSIALTCFEADYSYCHRNKVAQAVLQNSSQNKIELTHI